MRTEQFVRNLGNEALATLHTLLEVADTPTEDGVTAGHVLADWMEEHEFPGASLASHLRGGKWPITPNGTEHWAGQCSWTRTLLFWTTEEVNRRTQLEAKLRIQWDAEQEEQEEEEKNGEEE